MIFDLYDSFNSIAYKYAKDGSHIEAEDFMDCTVYEFYWRMVQKQNYIEWHNNNIKNATKEK